MLLVIILSKFCLGQPVTKNRNTQEIRCGFKDIVRDKIVYWFRCSGLREK